MATTIASAAPPGGRGAPPGGEEPPGGRGAPPGRLPRLSVGHTSRGGGGRGPRLPLSMGGGRPRPGQSVKTTTTVKDRRGLLREELQKYRNSRTDLSSGPAPAGGSGYSPRLNLGRKYPAPRAKPRPQVKMAGQAAAQAQAGQGTPPPQAAGGAGGPPPPKKKPRNKKLQGLGSPGYGTPRAANPTQPLPGMGAPLPAGSIMLPDGEVITEEENERRKQAAIARAQQWQKIHATGIAAPAPQQAPGLPAPGQGGPTP